MNIVQLTPGAGGMFCGNCFHDNALVAALRRLGHDVLMLPMYLPIRLDEVDQSAGMPVFFGGINVYLEQKSTLFRHAPHWLHRWLNSPRLLAWAAGRTAKTRAADVGELTLSMLRGEQGAQNREITELINWLKTQTRPHVVCLSNALLIGMARRVRKELGVPLVCLLQGEEPFLDALPTTHRNAVWGEMIERARDVEAWIAPSRWAADRMITRLSLAPERVHVVHNGINLTGYVADGVASGVQTDAPTLGYFARMCREKGLDTLVEAFAELRQRGKVPNLKLKIGGGCGPGDEPFVNDLRVRLARHNLLKDTSFHPNLNRAEKLEFLRSLTVFSVPALYGETFGLYLIEAMAAGVPVVQPRHGAFPELLEATGGGVICEPDSAVALADAIETLLLNPARARNLASAGQQSARALFNDDEMARNTVGVFAKASGNFVSSGPARRPLVAP
jgi:glycosyltransferase involved in cell wall biosynthesis